MAAWVHGAVSSVICWGFSFLLRPGIKNCDMACHPKFMQWPETRDNNICLSIAINKYILKICRYAPTLVWPSTENTMLNIFVVVINLKTYINYLRERFSFPSIHQEMGPDSFFTSHQIIRTVDGWLCVGEEWETYVYKFICSTTFCAPFLGPLFDTWRPATLLRGTRITMSPSI